MGLDVRDKSRVCRTPPFMRGTSLNPYLKLDPVLVAASLAIILTTASLVYHLMLLTPLGYDGGDNDIVIPYGHGVIAIDGDAQFLGIAMRVGWPGDGSPENPFIIDGLVIDRGGAAGHCISISNTRASFIMRNCRFTGAAVTPHNSPGIGYKPEESGAGILLYNVANGELVNNTCNSNNDIGIFLLYSHLNTVVNNTCLSNTFGISLYNSTLNTVINNTCSNNEDSGIDVSGDYNTVANNTCSNNGREGAEGSYSIFHEGISLGGACNTVVNNTCTSNQGCGITLGNWYGPSFHNNTVANNTCNSNMIGVVVFLSNSNTVVNNTCNSNKAGIFLFDSDFNTMANNTCFFNYVGIANRGANSNTMANNMCNNNRIGISLGSELTGGVDEEGVVRDIHWDESRHNTVTNNICKENEIGIRINGTSYNTVENNTCNSNDIGIFLDRKMVLTPVNNLLCWVDSTSNTVANNTCNYNRIGIYLRNSTSNTVVNNTFVGNTEYDILEESGTEEIPPDIFSCSDSQALHFWVQDRNW